MGRIITPGSPGYNADRRVFNERVNAFPAVIAYCCDEREVADAVTWASGRGMDIRVRSGGHNYEGYSVGNGVMVVDVGGMNTAVADPGSETLILGGGATNMDAYNAAWAYGRPFAGGTCPTVGVSGLTLGGGWGLSCRLYGLACDNLLGLELIDYRGRRIVADRDRNPHLFWACRGAGGGNFGVVTSMTFRLLPPVDRITFLEIYYPGADNRKMRRFLEEWQRLLPGLDMRLTMIGNIYDSVEEGGLAVYLQGYFQGPPEEAEALVQPLLDLGGARSDFDYIPFIEAVRRTGESYPDSERFVSTGRFVTKNLGPRGIRTAVGFIDSRPKGSVITRVGLYSLGGAVARADNRDTAFHYRNARYIMGLSTTWVGAENDGANLGWMRRRFPRLQRMTAGSYVNFPYAGLRDYRTAYYGTNAGRLTRIDRRYDPCNAFAFPQGLGLW